MSGRSEECSPSPEVWSLLHIHLENYRSEHEELFKSPETPAEESLQEGLNAIEEHAFRILTTGEVPEDLDFHDQLLEYEPGTVIEDKVADLLQYDLAQHRIEFDIAEDVLLRLIGLDKRIEVAILGFFVLLRAEPAPTAVKYYERACRLFLAGYGAESVVMCGAVLESALAERLSNEDLLEAGLRPAFRRSGDFSVGQRMKYEAEHPIFEPLERDKFWGVINGRNDAIHVQPDLTPDSNRTLIHTAFLLSRILPKVL